MSEELYFNDELRKCLNAAGLSDCGENDAWNYWYQRVYKAHNQTIDRVTEVQRAENAKLRELCKTLYQLADESYVPFGSVNHWMDDFAKATCAMRELGIEVDE